MSYSGFYTTEVGVEQRKTFYFFHCLTYILRFGLTHRVTRDEMVTCARWEGKARSNEQMMKW